MKKTTKILAVVLTLIMLLSTAPLFASAISNNAPDASPDMIYPFGEEETIDKIYRAKVGQTVNFDTIRGAKYLDIDELSETEYEIQLNYSSNGVKSFTALNYGVCVVDIFGRTSTTIDGIEYNDTVDSYTALIVVEDPDGMGQITGIDAFDQTFRYKDTRIFKFASPKIKTNSNSNVYYALFYATYTDDTASIFVDDQPDVYTIGDCQYRAYVVDAKGHVFHDDFTVHVKYAWWQQLIRIFLLGFLWY